MKLLRLARRAPADGNRAYWLALRSTVVIVTVLAVCGSLRPSAQAASPTYPSVCAPVQAGQSPGDCLENQMNQRSSPLATAPATTSSTPVQKQKPHVTPPAVAPATPANVSITPGAGMTPTVLQRTNPGRGTPIAPATGSGSTAQDPADVRFPVVALVLLVLAAALAVIQLRRRRR